MDHFVVVFVVALLCPAAAQNELSVSGGQDLYQAEESSNITMTWIFPFDTTKSPDLYVHLRNVKLGSIIYTHDSEMDTEPYPDELYRGRLHCDLQLSMKGQLECLLTALKLSDTGTYQCIIDLNGKKNYKSCDLNVTAATEKPVEATPKPESRGRIGTLVMLGLFPFAIMSLALYLKLNRH